MKKNIKHHFHPYYASGNVTRDQEHILKTLKNLLFDSSSVALRLGSNDSGIREIGVEFAVRNIDFMQRMKSAYQYGIFERKHQLSRHQQRMERRFEHYEWLIRKKNNPEGGWDIKHSYLVRIDQDPKTATRTKPEWDREKFLQKFRTDEIPLIEIEED